MSPAPPEDEGRVDRLRALAERVVARVGGLPAVRTLLAVARRCTTAPVAG